MPAPSKPRYYSIKVSSPSPVFDPAAILRAAFLGILATLASELGAAAAGGPPITQRDVFADIISGAAGGVAGEIALELGANAAEVVIVTSFVGGFVAESLFPGIPIPPRVVEDATVQLPCAG